LIDNLLKVLIGNTDNRCYSMMPLLQAVNNRWIAISRKSFRLIGNHLLKYGEIKIALKLLR